MTPRDFALLAQEAYTAVPDIGKADSASRAIVRHTEAGLCVAFPGTDDAECWAADLDILTVSVAGIGELHSGFWQAWSALAPAVLAAIGSEPVTFIGHSLGAAMAILAAASLTVEGRPVSAVYGFEPPRVSRDTQIVSLLAKVPMFLYRTGNDVVTDLPPCFKQAGALLEIGKPYRPWPNVSDHMLDRVIEALGQAEAGSDLVAA